VYKVVLFNYNISITSLYTLKHKSLKIQVRRILKLIRGVSQLYKIKAKGSLSYIVNEDHILVLKNKKEPYNILEISVKEYLENIFYLKNYGGYSFIPNKDFYESLPKNNQEFCSIFFYNKGKEIIETQIFEKDFLTFLLFQNNKNRSFILKGILDSLLKNNNQNFLKLKNQNKTFIKNFTIFLKSFGYLVFKNRSKLIIKYENKAQTIKIKKNKISNYYGFILDGNRRFLLSDFTVTHNSGKTYTMFGGNNEKEKGIIPRCCDYIFNLINNKEEVISAKLECSFLEIYKENMRDLLNIKSKDPLRIRTKNKDNNYIIEINSKIDTNKNEIIYIDGLSKNSVYSTEDIINIIDKGTKNRVIASTNLNDVSSRSHVIISLYLTQILSNNSEISSKLHLIDLAGSENVGKSGVQGNNLVEAQTINKSLSCLGNVIYALSEKNRDHIPYRDSRLTYLLKDSLGGNCKTHIIITVNLKNSYSENINSLRFGQRAKLIKNIPIINKNETIESLQIQLNEIKLSLEEYKNKYEQSNKIIEELKNIKSINVDTKNIEIELSNLKENNKNLEKQLVIYKTDNKNLQEELKNKNHEIEIKQKKTKEFLQNKEEIFKKQRNFSNELSKKLYKEIKQKYILKNELETYKIFFDSLIQNEKELTQNDIKKLINKIKNKPKIDLSLINFEMPEIDSP
jgi:hypothetical protein